MSSFGDLIKNIYPEGYGRSIPIITLDFFKSFFKEKRFYIAAFYYLVIPFFLIIIQSSQPIVQTGTGIAVYNAQLISTGYVKALFLSFFPGQIFLVILSADQIAGEVEQDTLPLLNSKPVYHSEIILGKFFGIVSIIAILETPILVFSYTVFLIKYQAEWVNAYIRSIDEVLMMVFIVILLQAIVLALAILISSIFERSLYAILTSLLSLFLLSSISDIIGNSLERNYLSFNWLIDAVLPNVFFNLESPKGGLIPVLPFIVTVIIIISTILFSATLILRNKELY